MDSKQKFIEVNNFEVEEWFADKMTELPHKTQIKIVKNVSKKINSFPTIMGWTQEVFGVVKDEKIFYVIEYLKEQDTIPLVLDIYFVSSDEYLDAILQKNTIETYEI